MRNVDIRSACIVGFDSAWTNSSVAPGAICAIGIDAAGKRKFIEPRLVTFDQALKFIAEQGVHHSYCLVAIDQPTIVPNLLGCRPVDRVAGALISWLGGGVQPACRSKLAIFGDDAPIWKFKRELQAIENPKDSRSANAGIHLIEVFPALALPSMNDKFFGRFKAPKYNPKSKRKFREADWVAVVETAWLYARNADVCDVEAWTNDLRALEKPKKTHQDLLDALICALIGFYWRVGCLEDSVMIGDLDRGYMISLVSAQTRLKLEAAAKLRNVPFG